MTVKQGPPIPQRYSLAMLLNIPAPLQLEDHFADEGQTHRDIPQDTQPYREFATGGHVESNKNVVTLAE